MIYAEPRADGRVALYADRGRTQLVAMMPRGRLGRRAESAVLPGRGVVSSLAWLPALPVCVVVPRIERVIAEPIALLILPGTSAQPGNMAAQSHIGEHCEITADYYRTRTTPPRSAAERDAADRAVAEYRAFMAGLPVSARGDVVVRSRVAAAYRSTI
jgi:hypothetical protein